MQKRTVLALIVGALLVFSAVNATAQVRLDVDVPWIITAGLNLSDVTGSASDSFDLSSFHLILPYIDLAYQFGNGIITGGVGIRAYTLLVEFMGWPMGYVELNLKPIVARVELGGFMFFLLGIYTDLYVDEYTLKVMIPDISVSFAFTDWFRLGVGTTLVAPLGNLNNFGWMLYIDARFAFLFGGKKQAN